MQDNNDFNLPEEEAPEYDLNDTGFNLEDDYKEEPLAPQGTYNGVVKAITFNTKLNAICWTVVAVQNPGLVLMDGETPIDGTEYEYRNWLPKPGDERIKSKSGKTTKRQTKINMLTKFQNAMEIDMNTPEKVKEAIENGDWIGISVIMNLGFNTYKGNTTNQIENMSRAEEEFDLPEYGDEIADDDIPF